MEQEIFYFFVCILFLFLALLASFIWKLWVERENSSPCPYTGRPLRFGSEIHWMTAEKVLRYLYHQRDYYNQMFDVTRAALCRDTGRLFPNAMTWYGTIKVDWSFLQKRYPGTFVSWGSLTEVQQLKIRDRHASLEGFQTEFSSPTSSPRAIELDYVYKKPGPLYVDIDTGILLGWKIVPDTELEVLIVQRPLEIYIPGLHKKY